MNPNNPTSTKGEKNNTIQIFRALAIIAVVMIHTCPPGEWQIYCRPFINFSVATFLFLSGYLTKTENDNWKAFYKNRITRVIIPYIIWTILYSSLTVLKSGDVSCIAKNLLTARAAATMYYIFVYIQFVLLTPLLGKLAKSKYRNLGWFVAPLSTLIFKYYSLLSGIELNPYVSLFWGDCCLGWFTYYYLGLVLGNHFIERNFSLRSLVVLYFASMILQMAEGYGWLMLGEANCGTQIKLTSFLTSTIFLLIIYTILKKPHFAINSKFLRLLGDYSFGIYLCHIMVMRVLAKVPYYSEVPFPVNSAIVVLVSLACCCLGYRMLGNKLSGWMGIK